MEHQVQNKFDNVAAEYSAKYEHPTNILGLEKIRRMELLVEYAHSIQPNCLLDAGCGPGVVLSVLGGRLPHATFVGTDLSYSMLHQAHARNLDSAPLVQSRVEQPPFANNSFDLVYALGVLDYLADPVIFFKSVQRIVRPGGYIIFTYPNGDSVNRALRTFLRSYFGRSKTLVSATDIKGDTIERLIPDYGFQLIRKRYITYGNGLVSFPWSLILSRKMEEWCYKKRISRYLAWSCLCVVRKVKE